MLFAVLQFCFLLNNLQATPQTQPRNPNYHKTKPHIMKKHNWVTLFLLCLQVLLSAAVGLEAAQMPAEWGRRDTGVACEPYHSRGDVKVIMGASWNVGQSGCCSLIYAVCSSEKSN